MDIKFRDFTDTDWLDFAGCEGDNPQIWEWSGGLGYDDIAMVCIVDDAYTQIHWYQLTEAKTDTHERIWNLDRSTDLEEAREIARTAIRAACHTPHLPELIGIALEELGWEDIS